MVKANKIIVEKICEQAQKTENMSIVLTGGGTAGHVIPNIALLPELEKRFDEIHYIGSFKGIECEILKKYPQIQYHSIPTAKLRRSLSPRNIARNIKMPFTVLSGMRCAKKMLKNIRPSIVFSKGGFVAYPVVKSASALKIPVIIHESDLSIGLANKASIKHANLVCTSFEKTADNLSDKLGADKVIYTGTPIRNEIFQGRAEQLAKLFDGSKDQFGKNILVIGGSLGATRINQTLVQALPLLKDFRILHITGKGKLTEVSRASNYIQVEYIENPADAYIWADVTISRAGSGVIFELLALKRPTLLIPLSSGRGDQLENAKEFFDRKIMNVLLEENLTPENLLVSINETIKNFTF